MIKIYPAVLANTEDQYREDILKLTTSDTVKDNWVHIDFADNIFVQNQTISPDATAKYTISVQKEAHLMVAHPKEWIKQVADSGFARIIFHIESEDDINEVITAIKNRGLEVGLAIKMDTPIEELKPFISKIDVVLVMSIVPGFQGQPFISESLDRIKQLKAENPSIKIGVDGAVRDSNAKMIMQTGIDFMIVGSYLLKGDTNKNYHKLLEVMNER